MGSGRHTTAHQCTYCFKQWVHPSANNSLIVLFGPSSWGNMEEERVGQTKPHDTVGSLEPITQHLLPPSFTTYSRLPSFLACTPANLGVSLGGVIETSSLRGQSPGQDALLRLRQVPLLFTVMIGQRSIRKCSSELSRCQKYPPCFW